MQKCGVTLLAFRFEVMIVQRPFASSEIDPFVGCIDGENILHIIVCDVVLVSHICIRQNIF